MTPTMVGHTSDIQLRVPYLWNHIYDCLGDMLSKSN
jgi:hypothetical protein